MIDPYEVLGIPRNAGEEEIKAAFKRQAKTTHPDAGGAVDEFVRGQKAAELLLDPLRRKVFDATGFDPELADPLDLQGALVIEALVNDIVLDEREPGSFDLLAMMRRRLEDDLRKARAHVREMERHIARIEGHINRLGATSSSDPLRHMLRARIEIMAGLNRETEKQIAATERASEMLEAYFYEVDRDEADTGVEMPGALHSSPASISGRH
jgi:curved DNA-binding protein CbpA